MRGKVICGRAGTYRTDQGSISCAAQGPHAMQAGPEPDGQQTRQRALVSELLVRAVNEPAREDLMRWLAHAALRPLAASAAKLGLGWMDERSFFGYGSPGNISVAEGASENARRQVVTRSRNGLTLAVPVLAALEGQKRSPVGLWLIQRTGMGAKPFEERDEKVLDHAAAALGLSAHDTAPKDREIRYHQGRRDCAKWGNPFTVAAHVAALFCAKPKTNDRVFSSV